MFKGLNARRLFKSFGVKGLRQHVLTIPSHIQALHISNCTIF
jgi:hypothetical protein